jgi:hypothetical protein
MLIFKMSGLKQTIHIDKRRHLSNYSQLDGCVRSKRNMAIDINILIGGAAGQGVHAITLPLAKTLVRQGCHVLFVGLPAASGAGTCQ